MCVKRVVSFELTCAESIVDGLHPSLWDRPLQAGVIWEVADRVALRAQHVPNGGVCWHGGPLLVTADDPGDVLGRVRDHNVHVMWLGALKVRDLKHPFDGFNKAVAGFPCQVNHISFEIIRQMIVILVRERHFGLLLRHVYVIVDVDIVMVVVMVDGVVVHVRVLRYVDHIIANNYVFRCRNNVRLHGKAHVLALEVVLVITKAIARISTTGACKLHRHLSHRVSGYLYIPEFFSHAYMYDRVGAPTNLWVPRPTNSPTPPHFHTMV